MAITRKQQPPKKQQPNPDELIQVAFTDLQGTRHPAVKLPRRLIGGGTQRAKQDWLIAHGEIPDPNAPEMPALIDEVVSDTAANAQAAADLAVQQLRAQLDELQGKLDGQPLSHAELVAARQDLTEFMVRAADANAQLVQVEGRGSQIKAELSAIATPLNEQASETARRQQENEEVQQRVLSELQAQAQSLLESLTQSAAAVRTDAVEASIAEAVKKGVPAAENAAREVANNHWGSSVTICPESPEDVDPSSWAKRWYGRNELIEGDGVFVTAKDGITAFRYAGGRWLKSAELAPKTELVSQQLSVHDESKPVTLVMGSSAAGGGGGGGSQRLSVRTMTGGVAADIADSSCWSATGTEILAGELLLRVSNGTGSAFLATTFNTMDRVNWEHTDFSLLGNLTADPAFNIEIRPYLTTPRYPAGITPSGSPSSALIVEARIMGGVGTFFVEGSIQWTQRAMGTTSVVNSPTPAWQVI